MIINKILDYYLQFSSFTDPGLYKDLLIKDLPNEVHKIGFLVRKQIIHRVELGMSITDSSTCTIKKVHYQKIPWYRQPEDDSFPTATAILAELYRRNRRGFVLDRKDSAKLVLTCRFVAILMASILKSKGIPSRVRSGFAPYFKMFGDKSVDHWINQYWNKKEKRWVTIDVDGSLSGLKFDPYDIQDGVFDFSADAWIAARKGKIDANHFWNAGGHEGLVIIAWELFYDFHCLMNNEIIYAHHPSFVTLKNFPQLKEDELEEIDQLAYLMQEPDKNFDKLINIWESNKKFRLLKGGLL